MTMYGMLLSIKQSATMGGSLKCVLSYATFYIGDKAIKIDGETRVPYVFGDSVDKDSIWFLDTDVNAFRGELIIQEV